MFCWIMNRIQSKIYRTGIYEINKISSFYFEDKNFILDNGIDALALSA